MVSPSMPSALPYALHRMPVTFWFSSLWMAQIASNIASSSFRRMDGWVNVAVMFSNYVLAMLAA
eukprot:6974693-Ditylum_brightwellii.AAC.1